MMMIMMTIILDPFQFTILCVIPICVVVYVCVCIYVAEQP
jgi:hypothetical protein